MPKGHVCLEGVNGRTNFGNHPSINRLKDNRFDPFKIFLLKLERKLFNSMWKLPRQGVGLEDNGPKNADRPFSINRYFDALEGLELEIPRVSEEIVLPQDKQCLFPLQFAISSFGMCLGVSSQAVLWNNTSHISFH